MKHGFAVWLVAGLWLCPGALAEVAVVRAAAPAELRFTFAATDGSGQAITLDRFLVEGRPLAEDNRLRVRRLAEGVSEISAESPGVANWEFDVGDESSYFGMGERYDRMNRAHTIIKNASRDAAGAKGNNTYQPVPFFLSLRGYGLWLDTYSDATFDFNVTERYRVRLRVDAARLRFVLFEGPRFATILERFTALTGASNCRPTGRLLRGRRAITIGTGGTWTRMWTATASWGCRRPSS